MANGGDQVRVSLDELRTEIRLANAELELSLRKYIADELKTKASADSVVELGGQLAALRSSAVLRDGPVARMLEHAVAEIEHFARGEFTPAQLNALSRLYGEDSERRSDREWTGRERVITILAVAVWLTSLLISATGLVLK